MLYQTLSPKASAQEEDALQSREKRPQSRSVHRRDGPEARGEWQEHECDRDVQLGNE
jgi:hypothetical protein